MNAESFCYWLKGSIELGNITKFDELQVQIIQDHLNLVFNKVTPNYQSPPSITLPYRGPSISDSTFPTFPRDSVSAPFNPGLAIC